MTVKAVEDLANALQNALGAIAKAQPSSLEKALDFIASSHDFEVPAKPLSHIARRLETCGPNDTVLDVLSLAIHAWDHREGNWAASTAPHSEARRKLILTRLGFSAAQQEVINHRIPRVSESDLPIVIAQDHEQWYDDKRRRGSGFYWDHYKGQLLPPLGRWDANEVELLSFSIDDVISRLSDPSRLELFPAKGLVMGYVQSGKTSHFSGLIAKASDAGYRLIIILAGTLDILRKQTQRRIDKEIVGRELLRVEEYGQDSEWESFVSHGGRPSLIGAFDWERLTNSDDDYKSLKRRLTHLEFKPADRSKPFNHPDNLRASSAKLAVIKKTPTRLRQLCDDLEGLKELRNRLELVPTLVIDDESDQASINTINQSNPELKGQRTSTNREIGRLLSLLPRAQYVGYTATPFANVFIDPEDAHDLFPKDFIISLRRPDSYMGARDFYDFDRLYKDGDFTGNRNAFVRPIEGENNAPANLPKAIDAFILAGAIKLFRENADGSRFHFRHHTMLIHHASTQVVHDADKQVVEQIFRSGARYQNASGLGSLKELFDKDFGPVSEVRARKAPMPKSFERLIPFIAQCVQKVCSDKAVRIVNGAERHRDDTPDFDAGPVWAILVGGTKLSRGYTVEGLTVSYYRRPTGAGDTLMQMGRWFGFRSGYSDLVRLFIGRKEKRGKTTVDLYEAFGAICRDEEALREDLRKYAAEGVKPWQVPPLVKQHLADLPPTSRNKMFNAEIESRDHAGDWTEKTSAPTDAGKRNGNLALARDLLNASAIGSRSSISFKNVAGEARAFDALIGRAESRTILAFLEPYEWADGRRPIDLELDYIKKSVEKHQLTEWVVLLPQLSTGRIHDVSEVGSVSVIGRTRASGTRFGVYSEPRHVDAAKAIAGVADVSDPSAPLQTLMHTPKPVLVVYYVADINDDKVGVSVGFGIQYPGRKQATSIQWTVRKKDKAGEVVVSSKATLAESVAKRSRRRKMI